MYVNRHVFQCHLASCTHGAAVAFCRLLVSATSTRNECGMQRRRSQGEAPAYLATRCVAQCSCTSGDFSAVCSVVCLHNPASSHGAAASIDGILELAQALLHAIVAAVRVSTCAINSVLTAHHVGSEPASILHYIYAQQVQLFGASFILGCAWLLSWAHATVARWHHGSCHCSQMASWLMPL
jgi:hypothetical protein